MPYKIRPGPCGPGTNRDHTWTPHGPVGTTWTPHGPVKNGSHGPVNEAFGSLPLDWPKNPCRSGVGPIRGTTDFSVHATFHCGSMRYFVGPCGVHVTIGISPGIPRRWRGGPRMDPYGHALRQHVVHGPTPYRPGPTPDRHWTEHDRSDPGWTC